VLTELIQLPYLVGSAEIGTKVLNDPVLRAHYLDAEHKGVKVLLLFTHQPGNVHTTKKAIHAVEDMRGLRIRFGVAHDPRLRRRAWRDAERRVTD
jgi:TRAP-type transport system periplasmic protein